MVQSILINKGLKFTPLSKKNTVELQADIKNFTRKLRLMEFNAGRQEYNNPSLVKLSSTFTPERGRDRLLDIYVDFLHNLQLNQRKTNRKVINNFTKEEWKTITKLKNDKSVIIKESDNSGSCIIMDSQYYKEKMMEELSDTSTYQELENNIDKKTKKRLVELTKRYDNNLTRKEIKYLTEFEFKESNLYGLPKVHKSEESRRRSKNLRTSM